MISIKKHNGPENNTQNYVAIATPSMRFAPDGDVELVVSGIDLN